MSIARRKHRKEGGSSWRGKFWWKVWNLSWPTFQHQTQVSSMHRTSGASPPSIPAALPTIPCPSHSRPWHWLHHLRGGQFLSAHDDMLRQQKTLGCIFKNPKKKVGCLRSLNSLWRVTLSPIFHGSVVQWKMVVFQRDILFLRHTQGEKGYKPWWLEGLPVAWCQTKCVRLVQPMEVNHSAATIGVDSWVCGHSLDIGISSKLSKKHKKPHEASAFSKRSFLFWMIHCFFLLGKKLRSQEAGGLRNIQKQFSLKKIHDEGWKF